MSKRTVKTRIKTTPTRLILSLLFGFIILVISSCNVTRRVTTESSYYQRGDTTCTIVTKTVESYDATKKNNL